MILRICNWIWERIKGDLPLPYPYDRGYREPSGVYAGTLEPQNHIRYVRRHK